MSDRDLDAQAGEYVLGTLDDDERRAFESRLASDPALRTAVDAWERRLAPAISATTAPELPDPSIWRRIEAVLQARQAENFGGVTVRADAGPWEPLSPGADIKVLWVDVAARTRSFLLRLQPGAQVPAHPHPTVEECYVVAGDMVIGETIFFAGDYHAALAGIDHPVLTSRGGGMVFIRGPLYD
ncbi:MAG TPA: cupin domain-containing protein [Vineibacter sp.]|nr:cupin domain-containing protein [Vineibacter sp.]